MEKVRVSEVFEGIQGEGRFAGESMLFIRFSGCTRECSFCDTKYHRKFRLYTVENLIESIEKSRTMWVCFTGGEPLLWRPTLYEIVDSVNDGYFSVETNGDKLKEEDLFSFDYVSVSPKEVKVARRVGKLLDRFNEEGHDADIKVVTDLDKVGVDMLKYATMLMPLTVVRGGVLDEVRNRQIRRRVWEYCVKQGLRYSPRLHVEVWGVRRGR